MVERFRDRDIAPTLLERNDKLKFVMVVPRHRRIGDRASVQNDAVRRLLEEDRRGAGLVPAHFTDVRDVVPPDAVNPPDREFLRCSRDRQKGTSRWRDHACLCVHYPLPPSWRLFSWDLPRTSEFGPNRK